jgi:SAM-dependent methyltransferase
MQVHPGPALCEVCAGTDWLPAYKGPVRDGGFGSLSARDCAVYECRQCGVQRLEESACKDESFYEGVRYRELLGEAADAEGFWAAHDVHQIRHLNVLWPHSVRNRVVADVGCAAGSFLDHISALAAECLAIELCREYHASLNERGYRVFESIDNAAAEYAGRVEFAFSFSTVEHVLNPSEFFRSIRSLLAPDGLLLVSTPNRADVLMDLLGDEYRRFFYRTVHRWYFDMPSLAGLAARSGMAVVQQQCQQRFGISNVLRWLRDRRPKGDAPLPHFGDALINETWKAYLESKGIGDYLYMLLKRAE